MTATVLMNTLKFQTESKGLVMVRRPFLAVSCLLLLDGCGAIDHSMRAEVAVHRSQSMGSINAAPMASSGNNPQPLKVRCFDKSGKASESSATAQCDYQSVDLDSVYVNFGTAEESAKLAERRNYYLSFLLNIADQNCDTFLNRAFSAKTALDTTKVTFGDVTTGLTAGAATVSAPTAVGLGIANLVVGKSVDAYNSAFFLDKTFQALQSAITLEREDIRTSINSRKSSRDGSAVSYSEYTIYDAVSDLRRYSDACSVRVGVSRLAMLAEQQVQAKQKLREEIARDGVFKDSMKDLSAKLDDLRNKRGSNDQQVAAIQKQMAELSGLVALLSTLKSPSANGMQSSAEISKVIDSTSQSISDKTKAVAEILNAASGKDSSAPP